MIKELDEQIAALELKLVPLKEKSAKINSKIAELKKKIGEINLAAGKFLWKGKEYLIAEIVHKQTWHWNSDPYCGGCYEKGDKRIELWLNGRIDVVAMGHRYAGIYSDIVREFRRQFEMEMEDAIPLVDDGPP